MEVSLALKIRENQKLHDFLKKNSQYYVLLNRKPEFYEELLKTYKKLNREEKRRIWLSIIDKIYIDTNYDIKIIFL